MGACGRVCVSAGMVNKATIEVTKPKKNLNIVSRMRKWPLGDGSQFLWVHLNAISTDEVPEILNFRLVELALLWVGKEICVLQAVENEFNMLLMLLLSPRENKNVV